MPSTLLLHRNYSQHCTLTQRVFLYLLSSAGCTVVRLGVLDVSLQKTSHPRMPVVRSQQGFRCHQLLPARIEGSQEALSKSSHSVVVEAYEIAGPLANWEFLDSIMSMDCYIEEGSITWNLPRSWSLTTEPAAILMRTIFNKTMSTDLSLALVSSSVSV